MLGAQTQSEITGQSILCVFAWSAHHLPHPFLIPDVDDPGHKKRPEKQRQSKGMATLGTAGHGPA